MPEGAKRRIGLKEFLVVAVIGIAVAFLWRPGGESSATAVRSPSARKPLSELQATGLDGKPWKLSDHRGRVVLVNFWATWCAPCRMETPGLVRLADAYRSRGLEVVGFAMDEGGPEAIRDFASRFQISYPIVLPLADSPLANGIGSLPTTLLIDRQGRVAKTYFGAESEEAFRADVEKLLLEG